MGRRSLGHLSSTGANWVSIVVTQYQWNISSTEIFPLYNGSAVNDTTSHYYQFVTLAAQQVSAAVVVQCHQKPAGPDADAGAGGR